MENKNLNGDEAILLEKNGKKYVALRLTTFHDMPVEDRSNHIQDQFGLLDTYTYKAFYEIVDEKKFMLAKIKYGI